MEKWFIKTFKQRKTNFMSFLRERISSERIIQRNGGVTKYNKFSRLLQKPKKIKFKNRVRG